ncbi:MAG: hypothetical protein M1814_004547 [Vezdaea aestivalis]|nr:MAG: hypothetical protein M1814_004547 [Vezdaea aestivalis]
MVSFSCEACGDVLTKKKLDVHRNNRCRDAIFTCLDCMKTFADTEYRSHTTCISEAEKYQGSLYKSQKGKARREPHHQIPDDLVSLQPSVEDAADAAADSFRSAGAVAIVDAPPPAPSPPPAAAALGALPGINVFDFLNNNPTPTASQVDLNNPRINYDATPAPPAMAVYDSTLTVNEIPEGHRDNDTDSLYNKYGYTYGDGPVDVAMEIAGQKLITPAPNRDRSTAKQEEASSTDKKRKRHHVEDLDLSSVNSQRSAEGDDMTMTDAPPVLHSGLTGGLHRLLSRPEFPPSPDFSGAEPSPGSPLKRSKRSSKSRISSLQSNGHSETRKSSSSTNADDSRPRRKKHRRHHRDDSGERRVHRRHREGSEHSHRPRSVKAIEYNPERASAQPDAGASQVVLYQSRVDLFMSFINKGPDSEHGVSLNKALKRYHRERIDKGIGLGRQEEEKELWKCLRLKRNEVGEIVLFVE